MDALERIRSLIEGFAGYDEGPLRRRSDEQIRGFVGEALAGLAAAEVDGLPAEERSCYDRVLLRCEFANQDAFRVFDTDPTPQRIEATLIADVHVVEAASSLAAVASERLSGMLAMLDEAFDLRDSAMHIS